MSRCSLLPIVVCLGLAWAASTSTRGVQPAESRFLEKNLEGWEGLLQHWKFENDSLIGSSRPDGLRFNTFLCSKKKYRDFELRFQVRLQGAGANSGVQIRSEIFDREHFAVRGPQCDIGQQFWACLYGEHFGGKKDLDGGMMQAAPTQLVAKVLKKDDFNDYSIRCLGKRVTIRLNGETMVDREFSNLPEEGIIAWQIHGGGPMEVTLKNIRFMNLSERK